MAKMPFPPKKGAAPFPPKKGAAPAAPAKGAKPNPFAKGAPPAAGKGKVPAFKKGGMVKGKC